MRKVLQITICAVSLIAALCSCSRERLAPARKQCGSISLSMSSYGVNVTDTKAPVDVDFRKVEFTISGTDVDGQTYDNDPISFELGYAIFPVGRYTLTAFYQPDGEDGASFAGVSSEFDVIAAGSTTVAIDLKVTNSSVTVYFDDSLLPFYGNNVVVSFLEPRTADTAGGKYEFFFAPGSSVSYKVSAKALPNSGATSFESDIKTIVVPAHTNHTLTISAGPGGELIFGDSYTSQSDVWDEEFS